MFCQRVRLHISRPHGIPGDSGVVSVARRGTNGADAAGVVTPDINDVLVRHEDGRWWIDNGFGVNVLKRYLDSRLDAVRLARTLVSPWGGRVLVEDAEGWAVAESPTASVWLDVPHRHRVA